MDNLIWLDYMLGWEASFQYLDVKNFILDEYRNWGEGYNGQMK